MTELFLEYGLFLAEVVTVVIAIIIIVLVIAGSVRKGGTPEERVELVHVNEKFAEVERSLRQAIVPEEVFKAEEKARKKAEKKAAKEKAKAAKAKAKQKADSTEDDGEEEDEKPRVFVIDFKGDIKASAVGSLREEITAVLMLARPKDRVVLRLENAGGLVHEHGLAASQLARIKAREIPLTVLIDKVAASGGYMMACVADRIIAAPFAVLGSIGVLMQLPNFHRLLNEHGIEFEQLKGGQFKRTLTMFGENTDADRAKSQEEVEDTHSLFQEFVSENRPQLDLEKVATGEHWYGRRALELALCDELSTSDDYLVAASKESDIYEIKVAEKKPLGRKLADSLGSIVERVLVRLESRGHERNLLK